LAGALISVDQEDLGVSLTADALAALAFLLLFEGAA